MATIYTIKGTDSISSSRLNINDNFDNLNTELSSIAVFFGISAGNLTLGGTVAVATVTATGNITATGTLTATGQSSLSGVTNSGKLVHSVNAAGTTLPTAGNWDHSTYQVTLTSALALAVNAGDEGQEVVIKAVGTTSQILTLTPAGGGGGGVTTIALTVGVIGKDTVTLRYINSKWSVLSYGAATLA